MKNIPFFPQYETKLCCEDTLRITWFETAFSQSIYSYEDCVNGSNACTLIVVITAAKCHQNNIEIGGPEKPTSPKLILALAHGMLLGNSIHEDLKAQKVLSNINLTVPQAIKYSKDIVDGLKEWKSELHQMSLQNSLFKNLRRQWKKWVQRCLHKNKCYVDLYVVLICDFRSVLFVFNKAHDTVTMIDSHRHMLDKGAIIATVDRIRLKAMCQWFENLILKCYNSFPQVYELSYLYFREHINITKILINLPKPTPMSGISSVKNYLQEIDSESIVYDPETNEYYVLINIEQNEADEPSPTINELTNNSNDETESDINFLAVSSITESS
ncbi:hypothetical protein RN001_008919 [Aquatica leii]|uniref:Uncharacterized protein n=1 Tax=Aquatica leii TaxID=1421715 RepID=A0AAN7QJB3_9COLE|nr:hypothetical protein RN001_008919 [Aquatica leii]